MKNIILYTTLGCHLCEQVEAMLHYCSQELALAHQLNKVEIAESKELVERYGVRIPVLKINTEGGEELELGWPFDIETLQSFLKA